MVECYNIVRNNYVCLSFEFVSVLLLNGLLSIYVNEFSNIYEQAK